MATTTANLKLIKPALNEYYDRWNVPLNDNFDIIDGAVGALEGEVEEARGSFDSLSERLDVGMNPDGTLKASDEIVAARSSKVYGSDSGSVDFLLDDRLEAGDMEVWNARQELATLMDAMAWSAGDNVSNSVVDAPTNYLTFSGAVVSVNGDISTVVANINGYRQAVRVKKSVTITGSSGKYYIYLNRVAGGEVIINGPATTGSTSAYAPTGKTCMFSTSSTNFVTGGAKPGDILTISAPTGNATLGSYVVLATNTEDPTNLDPNQIRVIGEFPTTSTGLTFSLSNPVSPTLTFSATAPAMLFTPLSGQICIGECQFDGTNVTSLIIYAIKGKYADFTQVTLSSGNFSLTIPHNLGFIPRKISIYGSQASDYTQPLELLSVADISGGGSLQRSVIARTDNLNLTIKNPTNGVFYKDFSGTAQTSGYLFIVAER